MILKKTSRNRPSTNKLKNLEIFHIKTNTKKFKKKNVLILDDFGLHPIDEQSKLILLELLEDRYAQHSMIITSQFPLKRWHEIIANPTVADAICDRLFHNAYKIDLKGESMRKKKT